MVVRVRITCAIDEAILLQPGWIDGRNSDFRALRNAAAVAYAAVDDEDEDSAAAAAVAAAAST